VVRLYRRNLFPFQGVLDFGHRASCTGNWQDNWFMDGKFGKVEQSKKGMNLIAGAVNRSDAHHAVLWTKKSFTGDLKLEYNYTKTDTQIINVNILYLLLDWTRRGTIFYLFQERKRVQP
jgi:hypothetical protein